MDKTLKFWKQDDVALAQPLSFWINPPDVLILNELNLDHFLMPLEKLAIVNTQKEHSSDKFFNTSSPQTDSSASTKVTTVANHQNVPFPTHNSFEILSDETVGGGGLVDGAATNCEMSLTDDSAYTISDDALDDFGTQHDEITMLIVQSVLHNNISFPRTEQLPTECYAYIRSNIHKSKPRKNRIVRRIKRKWSSDKFRVQAEKKYLTVLTQTEKEITAPEEITDTEERKIKSFVQGKPSSQKINAKTVDSIQSKTQKSSNSPLGQSRNKKNTTNTDIRLLSPRKKRAKISKNNDTKGIKRYGPV